MGSFFTTICAQASKTAVRSALRTAMHARGYRTDNKNPEISFSIAPCGGKWCCVKGDQMDFDDFEGIAADLSAQLSAPLLVADCVDSDFLYLTLHRFGKTDMACAGTPYDEEPPVPSAEFWQDLTNDFDAFTCLLKQDRVFAEEALIPLGAVMGFDGSALLPSDVIEENIFSIGFSRTDAKLPPLITSGPTKLAHCHRQKPEPYRLDTHSTVVMHNYGGPSKGLEIIVEAEFSNHKDLTFEIQDALIRDMTYYLTGREGQRIKPEFECIPGRRNAFHALIPDFQIPDGINPDYKYRSIKQQMDTEFPQNIVFHYNINIPEHLSKLDIHFIPMEYPEGAFTWRLEDCWFTPQEWEMFYPEGVNAFYECLNQKNSIT